MSKKSEEKRTEIVGGFTTPRLKEQFQKEASKLGRSASSHLHKLLEERFEVKKK